MKVGSQHPSAHPAITLSMNYDGLRYMLQSLLILAGLLMSFLGYRLYRLCLGVIAFVLFFSAEGAIGGNWLEDTDMIQKQILVLFCCLAWGLGGLVLCLKVHKSIEQKLGFLLGALLGFGLVGGVILAVQSDVDQLLPEYKDWQEFAIPTLGLPIAILCGYLLRNMLKYAIMLTTAAGGAFLAIYFTIALVVCSGGHLGPVSGPKVKGLLMGGLGVIGFFVQVSSDPERNSGLP